MALFKFKVHNPQRIGKDKLESIMFGLPFKTLVGSSMEFYATFKREDFWKAACKLEDSGVRFHRVNNDNRPSRNGCKIAVSLEEQDPVKMAEL